MLKKKESFLLKANNQMQQGDKLESLHTIRDGLNHYQNIAIKAITPYPTADAALLVSTLRILADRIENSNPECKPLVEDISKNFSVDITDSEKIHKTRKRR